MSAIEAGALRKIDIILVAAVAENGVIGRDGGLPWRLKSDLQYFKSVTMNKPMIMGRRTFQSIGRALKGRTSIVVTRDADFAAPDIVVAPSLEAALVAARGDALRRGADAIAVIGGTDIFAQTMAAADRLVLTVVHARPQGDALFPDIDQAQWREIDRRAHPKGLEDDCAFTFATYIRRGAA